MPYDVPSTKIYGCRSLNEEEKELFVTVHSSAGEYLGVKNTDLLRDWLKSGMPIKEYTAKYRGKISSKNIFGFMK